MFKLLCFCFNSQPPEGGWEPQGQTCYVGNDEVIASTGSFQKAHGDGAACDKYGDKYKTQREYLIDLLGEDEYARIFAK